MAVVALAANGTGNSGTLAADTIFYVEEGEDELSTDAGTTYIPWQQGQGDKFSSGLTVHWRNRRPTAAVLKYMSI